jgi:hypothetical protein
MESRIKTPKDSVLYTIDMFRETFKNYDPKKDQFLRNLLIEDFLLHTRRLYNCFFADEDSEIHILPDDITIKNHFCENDDNKYEFFRKYLKEWKSIKEKCCIGAINKHLAHLTEEALNKKTWPLSVIYETLNPILEKFEKELITKE